MAKLTLTQAQRLLLGIISSVESGYTTPEEGIVELEKLQANAKESGVDLIAAYKLADFQRLRQAYIDTYETSTDPYDSSSSY